MWTTAVLSAVAGFVDAACYLGLSQVFTAHVTGNLAALASSLVHPSSVAGLRVEVLIAFGIGAASGRLTALRSAGDAPERTLQAIIRTEALWLVGLPVADLLLRGHALHLPAVAWFAAGAMGCQSAGGRLQATARATTVMTSNYTQWSIALTDALLPVRATAQQKRESRRLLKALTLQLAMFVIGAAAGALGEHRFGFEVIGVPLAALIVVAAFVASRAAHANANVHAHERE